MSGASLCHGIRSILINCSEALVGNKAAVVAERVYSGVDVLDEIAGVLHMGQQQVAFVRLIVGFGLSGREQGHGEVGLGAGGLALGLGLSERGAVL